MNGCAKDGISCLAGTTVERTKRVKAYTGAIAGAGCFYSFTFKGAAGSSGEGAEGALARCEASGRA